MLPHDVAPVLVMVSMCVVGIVAILVRHQQKMTMILRGQVEPARMEAEHSRSLALALHGQKSVEAAEAVNTDARLQNLERQIAELKDLVHQQTLMLDSVVQGQANVEQLRQRSETPRL